MTTFQAISKEDLARLSVKRYEGPLCLAVAPGDIDRARRELPEERVVGLDTETKPAFRKGEFHLPSLVQVATSRCVYLFPLQSLDCSEILTGLLEHPSILKVGIGLDHDFTKLKRRFPFEEKSVLDLAAVAKSHGIDRVGVRSLAGTFLGFRIPKGQSTSNWGRSNLTQGQILYAATDAWVCRELFLHFEKKGLLGDEALKAGMGPKKRTDSGA